MLVCLGNQQTFDFSPKHHSMKQVKLKLLLIFLAFGATSSIYAQVPDWDFVRNIPNADNGGGCFTATDAAGNFYLAGGFYNTITVGNITLTSAGEGDIVVVKYDASENILWARRAGGNGSDALYKIAVDGNGNVFLTGAFYGSNLPFANTTLQNAGNSDIFILKYDASGNEIWAKRAGGSGREEGRAIKTDAAGNLYMAGMFFSSTISFGNIVLNNTGSGDAFVVKYDASGNVVWAKSSSGNNEEWPNGINVDANGNVLLTGGFYSTTATFGGITLTRAGAATDMFIVKYDSNGNVLWAKNSLGNHDSGEGFDVVTDNSGYIFVTGGFNSGSLIFGNLSVTSVGGTDVFLVKYDPAGNTIWAKSYGGSGHENGTSLCLDPQGNIYAGGIFASSNLSLGVSDLSTAGERDIFLAKFDPIGNAVWGKRIGSTSNDFCYSIAGTSTGDVFLAGSYSSPATVGAITLNDPGILVAKLKKDCDLNYLSCCTNGTSCIVSNFNGTQIQTGRYVWFNSVVKVSNVTSYPLTIRFANQTISSTQFNFVVPDAELTIDSNISTATSSFVGNKWVTVAPRNASGNYFISGIAYLTPEMIPGGMHNINWCGTFTSTDAAAKLNWKWAAAVYTTFTNDFTSIGAKASDDNHYLPYQNSDHAGSPENYKQYVIAGATGGGGSNYTGGYSGTASVTPCYTPSSTETLTASESIKYREIKNDISVKVFPNPTENHFNLVVETNSVLPIEIRIFDIAGKLLVTLQSKPGESISVGDKLKNGVYIAEIIQENKRKIVKLIKQ